METSAAESDAQAAANGASDLDVWSNSDADSSYGDLASETASLTSSIMAGHFENGRRYHAYQKASGQYILPDDEQEQDRLDIKYASIQLVFSDKVTFAPLESPQQILDIGTGTGIWAIDAGEQFPSATVTATDLSPIQPTWCVLSRFIVFADYETAVPVIVNFPSDIPDCPATHLRNIDLTVTGSHQM